MHNMVNCCISVFIISTPGVIGRVGSEGLIRGTLEVVQLHPLCKLRILEERRNGRIEVSVDGGGVVAQSGFCDEFLDKSVDCL